MKLAGHSMKAVLVLILLAVAGLMAQNPVRFAQNYTAESVSTDSCSGGLLFSWHMEAADVTAGGVAGGVNNGCSVGDTTGTATGTGTTISTAQHEDGSNASYFPGYNRYYLFSMTGEDIASHTAGTVDLWVYVTTFSGGADIWTYDAGATNLVYILMNTVATYQQFQVNVYASSTGRAASTTFATGFSLNTWYHVVGKWDYTAHGGNYLQICADTTTGTTNCGVQSLAPNTWAGTAAGVRIGSNEGSATEYVDNLKVYNSWR